MPFDPNLPQENTLIDAAQMRSQLQGLKALIDAILTLTAEVDGVNTGNPSDPANAAVSVVGSTLHFTFTIPRGSDGAAGPAGAPFAQAIIDAVNTLDPGNPATVSVTFDGANVHFTFGIPRGNDGAQGPPGEVSNAQLASAISGTSNNTNGVATLDTPFSNDPPTLADMETMRQKMNEMLLAARR